MWSPVRFRFIGVTAFALSLSLVVHAQTVPSVSITGGSQPLTLTAADLASMPRAAVRMDNNGIETVYEGVWISEIPKKAGVRLGEALRGAGLATYVLASASDGYQVVFSIGELDPVMTDEQFLLADKADGKPLFGENGAFRLVTPTDKRGARSVRMLTKLEIVQVRK
jgi:hypothetical protein